MESAAYIWSLCLHSRHVENPDLCSLVPDFVSDTLSPSSVWLPKPMSCGKFMRTFKSFLELIGVPKKVAQGVKYNYIRRFLTLGEVLRVDTTEAQSLSNWIEIAQGRDRREARANHPTSGHYAGDKLTSSGLVKPCVLRHFVRRYRAVNVTAENFLCLSRGLMYGWLFWTLIKLGNERCMVCKSCVHTNNLFPKDKVVVEAEPSNREKSMLPT